MSRLRANLLLLAAVAVGLGQTGTPLANPEVRRLGEGLRCMCGCSYTITSCNMLNCHWVEPARRKLAAMVDKGMSDAAIYEEFVRENGRVILTKPPSDGFNAVGWVMPYAALAAGLAAIAWFLKRLMRPAAIGPPVDIDSEEYARYRERIEKDLSGLDS